MHNDLFLPCKIGPLNLFSSDEESSSAGIGGDEESPAKDGVMTDVEEEDASSPDNLYEEEENDSEEEEEGDSDDNMVADDNYVPVGPSQQQLTNIKFEANLRNKHSSILVDGDEYRYRIHRRDKDDKRRWYRCVSRWSVNCRTTACLEVEDNIISKLSCPHNHSPPLLSRPVRYPLLLYLHFS